VSLSLHSATLGPSERPAHLLTILL